MSSQYISVRETAQVLGVSEKRVMDLIESGKLQAYKIADQFLRLKRVEVVNMRSSGQILAETLPHAYTSSERLVDFFYFNDFYLLATLIIGVLMYIVFFTG